MQQQLHIFNSVSEIHTSQYNRKAGFFSCDISLGVDSVFSTTYITVSNNEYVLHNMHKIAETNEN